jgi:hypothetical protein
MDDETWDERLAELDRLAEEVLRHDLASAREQFEKAKEHFEDAKVIVADTGLNHPDGRRGLLKATQQYNAALHQYRLALQKYNAFLVHRRARH